MQADNFGEPTGGASATLKATKFREEPLAKSEVSGEFNEWTVPADLLNCLAPSRRRRLALAL